ncbi:MULTISPECIES: hypothetical protein [Pseudomonas]|uniref:hypothetical protein n=1 Tax=Pseudomonas TaxID=286 RepID=UPI000CD54B22|nr:MULTISPECIES: hypothetical protein [Pseudomonas]RBH52392.1 hypothetical protein C3F00_031835 [Pseudomonas sp. MWU13-2860]
MGQIIKTIAQLLFISSLLVVIYFLFRGVSSWRQGYTWEEMDWSQSGSTSVADFFSASDIGKREVTVSGKNCIEYYSYKDGLRVKLNCPK